MPSATVSFQPTVICPNGTATCNVTIIIVGASLPSCAWSIDPSALPSGVTCSPTSGSFPAGGGVATVTLTATSPALGSSVVAFPWTAAGLSGSSNLALDIATYPPIYVTSPTAPIPTSPSGTLALQGIPGGHSVAWTISGSGVDTLSGTGATVSVAGVTPGVYSCWLAIEDTTAGQTWVQPIEVPIYAPVVLSFPPVVYSGQVTQGTVTLQGLASDAVLIVTDGHSYISIATEPAGATYTPAGSPETVPAYLSAPPGTSSVTWTWANTSSEGSGTGSFSVEVVQAPIPAGQTWNPGMTPVGAEQPQDGGTPAGAWMPGATAKREF
jgi:hypothetical protein